MMSLGRRTLLKGIGGAALLLPARGNVFAQDRVQSAPVRGGTLNVGQHQNNTKTLDALIGTAPDERPIMYAIYNTLVSIGPDFSLEPELATSWDVEGEGRRYVIKLRDDVAFHDGTPFNAEAAKYNIDARLDPETKSPHRSQLGAVVESVDVVSSHVIAINLKYAWPALMATLSDRGGLMVSPTARVKFGADFGRNPVGTGAFKFKKWVQGTHVTLERNSDYFLKEQVYLDEIVFRTLPNTAIGAQRLNIGEIDYMENLTASEIRQVNNKIKTHLMPIGRIYLLGWRVDGPPFDNPKLRQAISCAIDRDRLNQIVFDGQGTVANSLAHPSVWYGPKSSPEYEYSLDRAKSLLQESGYDLSKPLILWASGEPTYNKIVTVIAEMLQGVGLNAKLSAVSESEYWSRIVQGTISWGPLQWVQRADPDMLYYWLLHSKGINDTPRYKSAEMERLLEEARATSDNEVRLRLYGEAEKLMRQDLPYVPLLFGATYAVVGPKIGGFVPMPDHLPRFRYMWKGA